MPKSPQEWAESVIRNLPDRTGKSLDEWLELVKTTGLTEHKHIVTWLKDECSLGQNTAYMIADKFVGEYEDPDQMLQNLYKGKEALKELYDVIIERARELGEELTVYQCKTYTVLRRGRQFAVIKPATKNRIDVGFALPEVEVTGRLQVARNLGGGDRITHKIGIESTADIDHEFCHWLKAAFDRDLPANGPGRQHATLFK